MKYYIDATIIDFDVLDNIASVNSNINKIISEKEIENSNYCKCLCRKYLWDYL